MIRKASIALFAFAMTAYSGRPVIKVWVGEENAFFLREDSTLYGMGRNDWSQLGRIHSDASANSRKSGLNRFGGMFRDPSTPIGPNLFAVVSVVPAPTFTVALLSDNTVWATGENTWGQLANGSIQPSPAFVQTMTEVDSVAVGDQHALYLKKDGTLLGAGRNEHGQLGMALDALRHTSTNTIATGVKAIWAVGNTSFFLKNDGSLWALGENRAGLIPGSSNADVSTPVEITGIPSGIVAIRASRDHAVVLLADGTVWGWGSNGHGALTETKSSDTYLPRVLPTTRGGTAVVDVHATIWGTVLTYDDGGVRAVSGDGRADIATPNGADAPFIAQIDITTLNRTDKQNARLTSFGCGDRKCYWIQSSPLKYISHSWPGAGVWETDGQRMTDIDPTADGQGRRKLASNIVSGSDLYWNKGQMSTNFPGETSWHYAPNESDPIQELAFATYSRVEGPTLGTMSEESYVLPNVAANSSSNGFPGRFLSPNQVYIREAGQIPCRKDAEGYNFCDNPIQAAADNGGTVFVKADPDGDLVTPLLLTKPTQLISLVDGVALSLGNADRANAQQLYGFDIRAGQGTYSFFDLLILIHCRISGAFGSVKLRAADCVFDGAVSGEGAMTFITLSGTATDGSLIVDSRIQDWGSDQEPSGRWHYFIYATQGLRISNSVFAWGDKVCRFASNIEADRNIFFRVGQASEILTNGYEAFESSSSSKFSKTWIGRDSKELTPRQSWILSHIGQVEVSDVVFSGTAKPFSTSGYNNHIEGLVLAGGRSGQTAGVLESYGSTSNQFSRIVVANHNLMESQSLLGETYTQGRIDTVLLFGNLLKEGGSILPAEGGTIANAYFFGNKSSNSAAMSIKSNATVVNTILDGELASNSTCTMNPSYSRWINSTMLASPCGSSIEWGAGPPMVNVSNSLLSNQTGTIRSENSIISSGTLDPTTYLVDVDGPDNVRETWWDNDYSPKRGGGLVDNGRNDAVPADIQFDLGGLPRILGIAVDIGAYEVLDLRELKIEGSVGGTTEPVGTFVLSSVDNFQKIVKVHPNPMWSLTGWNGNSNDFTIMAINASDFVVTVLRDVTISPRFTKTKTYDDDATKFADPLMDDWGPSCEFGGLTHWDFAHLALRHADANTIQLVLEANPLSVAGVPDGGIRVYLDTKVQAGTSNAFDFRFKIRQKPGGGWFVTREAWKQVGTAWRWVFDGDGRTDASIGASAVNSTIQQSVWSPYLEPYTMTANSMQEVKLKLPEAVTTGSVKIWIEGAGDEFGSATAPLTYTWSGNGTSFNIDGDFQDWIKPVTASNP